MGEMVHGGASSLHQPREPMKYLSFLILCLGTVKLRHIPRPKFTVCILNDRQHGVEAAGMSLQSSR